MQIAKVTATLKDLESKTSYSTLNITVTEVSTLTDTQPEEDSFWSNIKEAFSTGINFFAEVFQVIVIAIVFLMPVIVIAAIVLAVILIIRYRRKKKNGDNGEQN